MGLDKVLVIAQNPGPGQDFRKKDDGVRGGSTIGKMYEWMDWIGVNFFSFSNTYPHPGQFTKKDIDYDRLYTISKGYNKVIALWTSANINGCYIFRFTSGCELCNKFPVFNSQKWLTILIVVNLILSPIPS